MTNLILIGNPNTGKTTLFNTITKSNNHVGNWHGVTVTAESKKFKYNQKEFLITDLPGLYSLNTLSSEERVSVDYLNEHKSELVINICDANNLRRNLLLCLELLENGNRVLLAVNMANEVKDINYKELSKALGIVAIPIDARKKKGVQELLDNINIVSNNHLKQLPYTSKLSGDTISDTKVRNEYIDKLLNQVCGKTDKIYGFGKIDKIFYNKYLVLPIFLSIVFLVFVITFGAIGTNFSILIENVFDFATDKLNDLLLKLNISAWAHALVMQGFVGGIGVVVSFLPQVVLLSLCMNFLEDIGYLSRVAFMLDGMLKKVGLTGKSVFSLLMGYGCTTTAMLTTRGLDNISQRKRTALVLPFASCSAKLPVYALICSAFFSTNKVLMVFGLYLLAIAIGLIVSIISNKIKKQEQSFIMEMPPLRLPTIKKTLKNLQTNVVSFIKRVGGTLIVCSIIVWILTNLSTSFTYTAGENSILEFIAQKISFIFKPIGLGNWGIVVALLVGIVAKEMVVSCLSITNGIVGNLSALATSLTLSTSVVSFSPASALSFLVFILLYSPCLSAISVTAKELGKRFAIFVFFFQFVVAYIVSFIVYRLGILFMSGKILEGVILICSLALITFAVVKYRKRKKKCNYCKGKHCENCM